MISSLYFERDCINNHQIIFRIGQYFIYQDKIEKQLEKLIRQFRFKYSPPAKSINQHKKIN